MKNNFEKITDEAKKIILTPEEKNAMRLNLMTTIEKFPVRVGVERRPILQEVEQNHHTRLAAWWKGIIREHSSSRLFANYNLTPMPIMLLLTILFSGGISYAAEGALPNDLLYPIKISVNEPVRGFATFGEKAKADWQTRLAQRRLEETETLASNGSLDEETQARLQTNFKIYADRVTNRIATIEAKDNGNAKAIADITANFETSLRAHEQIFLKISEENPSIKPHISDFVKKIKTEADTTAKIRINALENISQKNDAKFSEEAKNERELAQHSIDTTENLFTSMRAQLDLSIATSTEIKIQHAKKALADGDVQMDAQTYGSAFVFFQQAQSLANEAYLLINASMRINNSIRTSPDVDIKINTQKQADSPKSNINIKEKSGTQEKIEANTDNRDTENKTEIKTNLNLNLDL